MQFEYDPNKSKSNKERHGIDFDEAQELWNGKTIKVPTYSGTDIERNLFVGEIDRKTWTAITTEHDGKTRIISVRRSRDYEEEAYREYRNK